MVLRMAKKKITTNKLAKKREVLNIKELGLTPLGDVKEINGKLYLLDFKKKRRDGIPIYDGGEDDNMRYIEITKEDLKFLKEELDELVDKLEDKVNVKKLLFQLIKDEPIEKLRKIGKVLDDPNAEIEEHNGCYELRFKGEESLHFGGADVFDKL